MANSSLYEDDILLWSETQADIIRRLGRTRRDLPNDFDIENVAEEIESVGRSERASVESFLRLLILHLIKIASAPESPAALHWREEALNFGADAFIRFAPSMAQRIDMERVWRLARNQAVSTLAGHNDTVATLPPHCPWTVEQLVQERLDVDMLLSRIEQREQTAHFPEQT